MDRLFTPGQVVATPGAIEALQEAYALPWPISNMSFVQRHTAGDWGEVPSEDARENKRSVKEGFRIMSSYVLPTTKEKIWVITEADRSVTTTLLPSEY